MIPLNVSYLKAMLICVPSQEVRYYLCGINFVGKDGEVIAYATDGHRISKWLIATEYDGDDFNIIINKDIIKAVVASKDKQVELNPTTGEIVTSFGSITGLIDGKYPDAARVVNKSTIINKEGECSIDSKYLSDAIKISNIICGKGNRCNIKQYNFSPDSTVVFTFYNVNDFIHGIMPVRGSWDFDHENSVINTMLK